MVRAIDLVDEQERARGSAQCGEQRALDQERLVVQVDVALAGAAQREHLCGIVPLVERGRCIHALVALEPDEVAAEHLGKRLARLGLADAWRAFQQQRLAERKGKKCSGAKAFARDVCGTAQRGAECLGGCERAWCSRRTRSGNGGRSYRCGYRWLRCSGIRLPARCRAGWRRSGRRSATGPRLRTFARGLRRRRPPEPASHRAPPCSFSARRIFSGVNGISSMRTPTASKIALAMAGMGGVEHISPTPLPP